jgi:hypothetical protein
MFDDYNGSTHYLDIQDEYGYSKPNGYRNRDYDRRNFWRSGEDHHSASGRNRSRRSVYTDKGYEEGGYNPNLNDGYYGEESRGYRGRNAHDYDNGYPDDRYYKPERYDRGGRRNNAYANRYNDYGNMDYRPREESAYGYGEERHGHQGRPQYNDHESYPRYRRNTPHRNYSGRRHYNSEYYDRSFRKRPYLHDSWY